MSVRDGHGGVNVKGIRIGLIVILSVMTVSLCGILVCGIVGGNIFRDPGRQNYKDVQLVLEKEVPLDGIGSISIMYGMNSNDIFFFESENNAVTIKEYSSSVMKENELSTIKVEGNNLEVRGVRRSYNSGGFHLFFMNGYSYSRHYTEVYLPTSYHGEILLETASGDIISNLDFVLEKELSITSTSGDVNFPSVTASNAVINTSSGYVKMENIDTNVNGSVGQICIKTSSGDVNVKELTGETNIESSSGYLTVESIRGNAQLKTSSGDMNIMELTGEVKMESSSGYQTIETLTGDAQLKTTSGDISIQDMNGNIQSVTTSGCVRILEGSGDRSVGTSSGDVTVKGTEGSFRVSTQSGDVQINVQKGEGSVETTSGDIQLGLEELAGTLNINSSSGYVNIKLSAANEFELDVDTSSGDIETFFDRDLNFSSKNDHAQGTYGTNTQGNRVEIRTTSGDVRISEY